MTNNTLVPISVPSSNPNTQVVALGPSYKRKEIEKRITIIALEPEKGRSKDMFVQAYHRLEKHITKNGYTPGEYIHPEQIAKWVIGRGATAKQIVDLAEKYSSKAWILAGLFSELTNFRLDVAYREFGPMDYRTHKDYNEFFVPENEQQATPYQVIRQLLKAAKDDADRLLKQARLPGPAAQGAFGPKKAA